jgi:hypothetical protein
MEADAFGHAPVLHQSRVTPYEVVSDALIGVEVRRVGGQLLQMQPLGGSPAQELFDCLAAMDGEPSQMRMILPRGLRSSTRRKPTTATLS